MASPSNSVGQGESAAPGGGPVTVVTIACNRCRKTKLRCSRDRPACAHCSKAGHECVYECTRGKPGVKAGAIENIHRRLDQLESRLLSQDSDPPPQLETRDDSANHAVSQGLAERVLTLLATELPKLASPSQDHHESPQQESQRITKRRRMESSTYSSDDSLQKEFDEWPLLPSSEMINTIVATYFSHIHPWIPMLHQDIFPQALKSAEGLRKMRVVLHAISLAVEPHLPTGEGSVSSSSSSIFGSRWPADKVRTWVVTTALENVTLEGLQALIIVAFNDIGNGNASRAWSLVASLSRTVEFAQLTMEHDEGQRQPICRPFSFLEPARSWTEQEERRRVFWNVFLLDRFCSITMGWNTSLKSIDVHQRLPCDGSLWRREDSGLTPYLGIWDKSTGGVGNKSCCFHGGEQSTPSLGSEPWTQPAAMYSSPSSQTTDSMVDMSRVGAFGYCVEATESMSRVVSYFLQQRVKTDDPAEVKSWLARFKELDLRLVHWKMLLPQRWKTNVPPSTQSGGRLRIDPNLALAHVTHNTSTILLHQVVAYPPPDWPFRKRLPSAWSADTCCFAGAEIATITGKYLEVTPHMLPITSPFAFCVYIAARMMLVHWRYEEENKLMNEFWSLVRCLDEMSKRWRGFGSTQTQARGVDLSAKYAEKLRYLYKMCSEVDDFRIFVSDYTCEIDYRASSAAGSDNRCYSSSLSHGMPGQPSTFARQPGPPMQGQTQGGPWTAGTAGGILPVPDITGTPYAPQPDPSSWNFAAAAAAPTRGQTSWGSIGSHEQVGSEDIQVANNMMGHLSDSFMDLDRVIAFTDRGLFTAELENENAAW